MKTKDEQLVLLATTIATQLTCGLSFDELEDLRCLVNQVGCSISTIISLKCSRMKRNNENNKKK